MREQLTSRRRAKLERLCPDAIEHYDRIEASGPEPGYVEDDGRWSGLAECEVCGNQLFDHPPHPFEPCLTITCQGQFIKL